MNVVVIYTDSYPRGKACTNRAHLFAKGLLHSGDKVQIIIHRPTEVYGNKIRNKDVRGTFEEIPFWYTAGTTLRAKSFLIRRYYDLKGFLIAGFFLIKNRKSIDAILFVSGGLIQSLYYKIITSVTGILYIHQKGELPFIYSSPNLLKKYYQKIYVNNIYKIFDGLIVISESLKSYFGNRINKNAKMVLIPILSNADEFKQNCDVNFDGVFKLVYAGTLCQKKDGVLNLLKSLSIVRKKGYNVHLYIVGDTPNIDDKNKIKKLIHELDLLNNVTMTGYLPRHEYVELLNQAELLVLAKPKSLEAQFCFPTKLGEYLLTGKPVLTTKNGVIPNYIIDGTNGFLSEPDDISEFASKIIEVIHNYSKALKAGKTGREMAISNFDYKTNGIILHKFIYEILLENKKEIKNKIKHQTSVSTAS